MAAAAMAEAEMVEVMEEAVTEVAALAAEMAVARVEVATVGVAQVEARAEAETVAAARVAERAGAAMGVAMEEPRSPHLHSSAPHAACPPSRKSIHHRCHLARIRERATDPCERIHPIPKPFLSHVRIRCAGSPSAPPVCRAARHTADTELPPRSTLPHASIHPCRGSSCHTLHRLDRRSTQAGSSGREMAAGRV